MDLEPTDDEITDADFQDLARESRSSTAIRPRTASCSSKWRPAAPTTNRGSTRFELVLRKPFTINLEVPPWEKCTPSRWS